MNSLGQNRCGNSGLEVAHKTAKISLTLSQRSVNEGRKEEEKLTACSAISGVSSKTQFLGRENMTEFKQ
jgi:hypothetical protein